MSLFRKLFRPVSRIRSVSLAISSQKRSKRVLSQASAPQSVKDPQSINFPVAPNPFHTIFDDLRIALQESNAENVYLSLKSLATHLENHRLSLSDTEWKDWIDNEFVHCPIFQFLYKSCPIVARCQNKPRGYAGDAPLLDLLYFDRGDCTSDESMLIRAAQSFSPNARRADFIGEMVDSLLPNTILDGSQWSALSVSSGHCRETEYSELLKDESISRHINVVAYDHDPLSLDVVKDRSVTTFNGCFQTCEGNVRSLLNPKYANKLLNGYNNGDKFDCIWSVGLYDYLSDRYAIKLTSSLFNYYLKDGGVLCFGNKRNGFMPRGYLEAQMDWWLNYRSVDDLRAIVTKAVPQSELSFESYTTLYGYFMVQITKKSSHDDAAFGVNNSYCLEPH